jgi:hypothetical protein
MEKIADSKEGRGIPATPVSSGYECRECGERWRYERDSGALVPI